MSLAKQKLIFDTTDTDSLAASDNVGAYLRSSDGTLITHTTVGTKQAIDVNIVEGINVEVDLSHTDDSVRLGDGTSFFTSTTQGTKLGLDVNIINTSLTVTAVDLDIRDLTAASDSVKAHLADGSGTALTSTLIGTQQALDVNVANTIQIQDVALANASIASTSTSLAAANTAQDIIATPLTGRKYLLIHNNDNRICYIGGSGVTASNGFPLSAGATLELRAGAAVDIEYVSSKVNHNIRTLELA